MPGKFLWVLKATHPILRNTASAHIPGAGLCGRTRLHEPAALLLGPDDQAYSMILKMSVAEKDTVEFMEYPRWRILVQAPRVPKVVQAICGRDPPWAAARRARGGGRKLGRAARTPGGPAGLSLRRVSPRPGPFWSRVCCLGGGDDGGSRTRPKFTKITRDSVSRGRRGALSLAAARVRNRRRCPTGRA